MFSFLKKIWSIRDNGLSLATIEIGEGRDFELPNGSCWSVKQVHGAKVPLINEGGGSGD